MRETRPDVKSAMQYGLLLLPVIVLSMVAPSLAIGYVNEHDLWRYNDYATWMINLVPPCLVGLALYGLVAPWRTRQRSDRAKAHMTRCALLYLFAGLCAAWIIRFNSSPDFGLVSQLFTWPLAATLSGIAIDAAATWRDVTIPPAKKGAPDQELP